MYKAAACVAATALGITVAVDVDVNLNPIFKGYDLEDDYFVDDYFVFDNSDTAQPVSSKKSCSINEDIPAKLKSINGWQTGEETDYRYAYICFLHFDQSNSNPLSILLENRGIDETKWALPGKDLTKAEEGQTYYNAAVEIGKQIMPDQQVSNAQLLNALRKLTQSGDEVEVHSTYAMFIPDKSAVQKGINAKWFSIRGLQLFDDSTEIPSDELMFYTKEILLSIQYFVHCGDQSKQAALKLPIPIQYTPQTKEDRNDQLYFYEQRGCMVHGSKIIYNGVQKKSMYQECGPALIHEMKRVCGQHYTSKDPTKNRCLVHGTNSVINWEMPRRSTILSSDPQMWAVAIVEAFQPEFAFEWPFHMALIREPNTKSDGMIMIFTIDNPDECEYQLQFGDDNLKPDTDPSKAVIRYDFSSFTYPTIDRSKVPDAWVYPSWAANECGLRLIQGYPIESSIPRQCRFETPLISDGITEESLNQWRYQEWDYGISGVTVCIVPYHWDPSSHLLRIALGDFGQSLFCQTTWNGDIQAGSSLRHMAVSALKNNGFKDVPLSDPVLLSADKTDSRAGWNIVFGVFSSEKNEQIAQWHNPEQTTGGFQDALNRVICN